MPTVKRWVKSVEEYYSAGGVRSERHTDEMEAYKVAEDGVAAQSGPVHMVRIGAGAAP